MKNEIGLKTQNLSNKKIQLEKLKKFKRELINLRVQFYTLINENKNDLSAMGLDINQAIQLNIDFQLLDQKYKDLNEDVEKLQSELENLKNKLSEIGKKKNELKDQLNEQQKQYQTFSDRLKSLKNRKEELLGDERKPGTINWLKKELEYLNKELNQDLESKRKEVIDKAIKIFNKKQELVQLYKKFKNYVEEELNKYEEKLGEYKINIHATLEINKDFSSKFLGFIDKTKQGSFWRATEDVVKDLLIKDINFENANHIQQFLNRIFECLEEDKRSDVKEESRYILDQIQKGQLKEFYDYIFSLKYLQPIYQLKLSEKTIDQLSPGERGALLIVFNLILDKDNIPLLIDQPEENLDNQSIYKILSYFIKLTKQRRQVILVTHNPNLAIVGDAEQIIFVHIDKTNKNKFSFKSGSIENPLINKHASDILEGTLKAFDIRRLKYIKKLT